MTLAATPRPCEGPEGRLCFTRCPECQDKWFVPDSKIIEQSYGFTISNDGEVYGLIAGDMGYEPTNIVIPIEDLEAWAKYNYRDAEITHLREELNAYKIRGKAPSSEDDR